MRTFYRYLIAATVLPALAFSPFRSQDDKILSYTVDPREKNIGFYWKDSIGKPFRSIANLKASLESNKGKLLFAMNGGMYKQDNSPLGLFIKDHKTLSPLNRRSAKGNFYLKPNGVFFIRSDNTAAVCRTEDFVNDGKIKYATQSGPMLLVNGNIHTAFAKGSTNLNIRNGVGMLDGNKVVFAMSKEKINLYDFAEYFRKLGCKNALYLDGFVSQTYLPEKKWLQTGGNFGVIIAVTE